MKKKLSAMSCLCGLGLILGVAGNASALTNVDLELSLLVDVSGSVDNNEYILQKTGYVNAFNSASLWAAIAQGSIGSIAVNYVEWSSAGEHIQQVGWTLIDSEAAAKSFATAINGTSRAYSGLTAPGSAINFATPLFASNDYDGTRQVIDVSGDGEQNDGANTAAARNAALAAGIDAINGLAIGGAGLKSWYEANIMGGATGFVIQVSQFADFERAVNSKLVKEISGVPEPTTMLLFGTGLAGLAAIGRRRKEN